MYKHNPQQAELRTNQQQQPQLPPPTQLPLPTKAICPKCHEPCSFQQRAVPNKKHTKTHLYWFAEHYDPTKDPPIAWHYIGKTLPTEATHQ